MMTLVPSSAKYSAISQPVAPPPTTATTLGRRVTLMAVSGVRCLMKGAPVISLSLRREPVARMKLAAV